MFIRTLLAIYFLATGLAAARCPFKTRSEFSDEGLAAFFDKKSESRSCGERKEDCTRVIRDCVSGLKDELFRLALEGAEQRICERGLRACCEAGGGGEAGNDGDNGDNDNDEGGRRGRGRASRRGSERGGSCGNGGRGGDGDGNSDQNVPLPTPSNPVSQTVPTPATLQAPAPSRGPSPRPATAQSQVPTSMNAPTPSAASSPPGLLPISITTQTPPSSETAPTKTPKKTQIRTSLETATTTATQICRRSKNNKGETDKDRNCNGDNGWNRMNKTTFPSSNETEYYTQWSLFCTDKAEAAIRDAGKKPPRCGRCRPSGAQKGRRNDRRMPREDREDDRKCSETVFVVWPEKFKDELMLLEEIAKEEVRGLKFPQRDQANGALGNGDLGRIAGLLCAALGVGSVVWGI